MTVASQQRLRRGPRSAPGGSRRAVLRLTRASAAAWLAGCLVAAAPLSAQSFDLIETTIAEVHAAMERGELTCRTLVQGYLDRIKAYDQTGPRLNTVQTLNERALDEADALDRERAAGGIGRPLHCVPVLLKDQVETSDMPTLYGSALFEGFVPHRDATLTLRLKGAGAIILAKTTMGEFASRYVGSAFGVIRNPYAPDRNPSGSSGGTGSGIAANLGLVGIGEDTGGSVRGPAAVASLVGLRPTLQLVSRHGMMPANPTQDTMGPMTRTVADAAIVLDAIAGYDPADPITAYSVGHVPESYTDFLDAGSLDGARIGVLRDPMDARADPGSEGYREVRAIIDRAIRDLASLGADVVDPVSISDLDLVGGIGNVYETERATDDYLAEHPNAPVRSLAEILMAGVVVPWRAVGMMASVGKTTDDPGYLEVMRKREVLRVAVLQAMADHELDAIVYATFDHPPSLISLDAETNPDPADDYGLGDNRGLSPAIGFPALTVPAGFTSDGLPVGLELLGRPWSDGMLLGYAYAYEQAFPRRRPPPTAPPLGGGR